MRPKIKILIIEDDEVDAEFLKRTLYKNREGHPEPDYNVTLRSNYKEGLNALETSEFDLILLDLGLPDIDGFENPIHYLRTLYPNIPIIVMTGYKDTDHALQSLRDGAQDYLIKGETNPRELHRSIAYAIERHGLKTELEETIAELNQKSSILHSILNHMGDGVIVTDKEGKLTVFNAAAVHMLDIRSAEHIPEAWPLSFGTFDPITKEKISIPNLPINAALQGEHIDDEEFVVVTPLYPEGRYISVTARPIDDAQHALHGCVAVLHDITQRRKVEAMKDEFVSTVSHELRTPLTSISGSLGLILGGVAGALPQKVKEMITIAQRNSDRLVRLINDLLDVQKLEAGKLQLCLKPIKISALIQRGIELNRGYALKHRVTYAYENHSAKEIFVDGDEDRLLQVLANLLSNAAKFSPPDGIVTICLEATEKDQIRVNVRDNGPGIPEEFQSSIFEKFSQADSSTTKKKGGTGLGLSICKSIVELHQGTIGFITSQGEGTTFYFTLPCVSGGKITLRSYASTISVTPE